MKSDFAVVEYCWRKALNADHKATVRAGSGVWQRGTPPCEHATDERAGYTAIYPVVLSWILSFLEIEESVTRL